MHHVRPRLTALASLAAVAVLVLAPAAGAAAVSTDVPTGDYPQVVVVSPDGTRAYASVAVPGGQPGRVVVIDTATDATLAEITVGVEPRDIELSADGTVAYVASMTSNQVAVIDTASNSVVDTWDVPGPVVGEGAWGLELAPDGLILYVSVRGGDRVEAISTVDGSPVETIPAPNLPAGLAIDPAGAYLYVARSATDVVRRIELATGTFVELDLDPGAVGPSPYLLRLNPAGSELWVSPFSGTAVHVLDTASFTSAAVIDVGATPRRVDFTAAGRVYVPVDRDDPAEDAVVVVDATSRAVIGATEVGRAPQAVATFAGAAHAYTSNLFGGGLTLIGPPLPVAPADARVDVGETATFSAVVRATWDTISWEVSSDGGASWSVIPGATDTTLSLTAALADDGKLYRFIASSALFGDAISDPAELAVTEVLAPSGLDPALVVPAAIVGAVLVGAGIAALAVARRRRS